MLEVGADWGMGFCGESTMKSGGGGGDSRYRAKAAVE